ncbi:MAG: chromate transporter [Candidatus Cloacimonadaceae bacterium]|jgi:chromate transporter|nr:chromate transporter [Candidatus Cloacimonadota bacterium]MCB5257852.1 chromate transporter [Candidatus Cloacimonadota bacterium]MDD5624880.1 chromate transporter [Candidatus Cloacimonadota bacterium]MDY0111713.1 chromate transporter [Candidatus Syntrophosphaera sp.]
MPNSLFSIFITFLKIGAFTIGGGYAMIPLIRREVVEKHHWINDETFMDGLAAAQSCPGPIAINFSVYIGMHLKGFGGMLVAVLGTVLPSFVAIVIIAALFTQYAQLALVQKAFHALKPAVVALIAAPLLQMTRSSQIKPAYLWVPVLVMILVAFLNISPIWIILTTIIFSILQSFWQKNRNK